MLLTITGVPIISDSINTKGQFSNQIDGIITAKPSDIRLFLRLPLTFQASVCYLGCYAQLWL